MPRSPHARPCLCVEGLEERLTPTFVTRPGVTSQVVNGVRVPTGGLSIAAGNLLPDPSGAGSVDSEYVTGTGPGTEGKVRLWRLDGTNGSAQNTPVLTITPFPGFTGGINVAVGDVTGDANMEIIAAVAANGPPHVKVFDVQGNELGSFLAFDAKFLGGVNIATGNVLGGIAGGGFAGGTVSGGFKQEIIIGAAAGDTPHVVVANAAGTIFRSFLAFDLGYRGGVTVTAADLDNQATPDYALSGSDTNAYDEIIVGAATNVPHVKAFGVSTGAIVERLSFYAFDPGVQQGVTVAAGPTDTNRAAQIFVSQSVPANSPTGPRIRVFGAAGNQRFEFAPFPDLYTRAVNLTVAYLTPGGYDPEDEDTSPSNFSFQTQDLAVVAADGPLFQEPRYFIGRTGQVAGAGGPP
ncbi:MAG: hypothetical protein K2V38_09140 [Gemmataceae bacterium]|nr:hypothetical protein [Gemmataceae bacterium]